MKKENKFILLCCLVYFTSYITRINYAATLVEMVGVLKISNAFASLAVTFSFVSYGVGQLVAGVLGDKLNPKNMLTFGLVTTGIINFMVGFSNNMTFILVVWTINGFAQALLWPPLVRLMTSVLSNDQYKKGGALVTIAASVAIVFVYLFSSFCIQFASYKLVFYISGGLGILVAGICHFKMDTFTQNAKLTSKVKDTSQVSLWKIILSCGLLPIMFVIVLQGMLRDGITTWMPTFIRDTFEMSNASSVLSTTILPLFTIFSIMIVRKLNVKWKNEVALSTAIWGGAGVLCIILLCSLNTMVLSTFSMALLTACMHGINLLLICNLPARFVKYGKVSTVSGVLNACTYIGSALSAYGIAKISEHFGWKITILIWLAIIVMGFVCSALSIKKSKEYCD